MASDAAKWALYFLMAAPKRSFPSNVASLTRIQSCVVLTD